jgi:hypothetical protein
VCVEGEGLLLVIEVNGVTTYVKASDLNLLMATTLPPPLGKAKRSELEMAVAGHPKREAPLPSYVVKIVVDGVVLGLGFRCGTRLITSRHVLKKAAGYESVAIQTNTNREVKLDRSWRMSVDSADLDCIGVEIPAGVWAILGVKTAKLSRPRVGDSVTVFGHDELGRTCSSTGVVRPTGQLFVFQHNASTMPGDSGGPILSSRGVIGVHCGSIQAKGQNKGVALNFLIEDEVSETSSAASSVEMYRQRYAEFEDDLPVESGKELDNVSDWGGVHDPNLPSALRGPRVLVGEVDMRFMSSPNGAAFSVQLEEYKFVGRSWADIEEEEDDEGFESGLIGCAPPQGSPSQATTGPVAPTPPSSPMAEPVQPAIRFGSFAQSFRLGQKSQDLASAKPCETSGGSGGLSRTTGPEVASGSSGVAGAMPSKAARRRRNRSQKLSSAQ